MPLTTSYEPGTVVLVPFMFTDMGGVKRRPAVVVSTTAYQDSRADIVIMAITSQLKPLAADVSIQDWAEAGLVKPGYVKAVIQTVSQDMLVRRLGTLSLRDLSGTRDCLRTILGL